MRCCGCFVTVQRRLVLFTVHAPETREFWEVVQSVEAAMDDQARVVQGCPKLWFIDGEDVVITGPGASCAGGWGVEGGS
jgi:hypothetical protein